MNILNDFLFYIYIFHLLNISQANFRNDFIVDYFNFKKVPSVVGFSCNNIEGTNFN